MSITLTELIDTIGEDPVAVRSALELIKRTQSDLSPITAADIEKAADSLVLLDSSDSSSKQLVIDQLMAILVTPLNSIADLQGFEGVEGQQVHPAGYHPDSTDGGGIAAWSTTPKRHNGVTFFDPNRTFPTDWTDSVQVDAWFADSGVDVVGWERVYAWALTETNIHASWGGVSEIINDNGRLYNHIVNVANVRGIETHEGGFNLVTPVTVPATVERFIGAGKRLTKFIQNSADAPANPLTFSNGAEYGDYRDFEVTLKISGTGTTTSKGVRFLGVRRSTISNIHVEVSGHTITEYSGVGLYIDMETVTNAYTNRIINNTVIGTTQGIWSVGPLTSSIFAWNHTKSFNGFRFDRQNVQAGVSPIVGNQIYGNTIQAHSSATFGLGNGIDFGQSDGALGYVYAYSNQIWGNYIEQFQNGIILRDGARNFEIGTQEWDNPTNEIVDLNPNKDGYSGFDAQNFKLSTKEQTVQFTAKGSQFTSKITGDVTIDGASVTLDVNADGVTVTTDKRRIRIWGNGAARTGAVLSRASAIEGQRLTLIGFSWSVALSATGLQLNGGAGVVLGGGSGQVALIEFEYDSSLDLWIECHRNTRP